MKKDDDDDEDFAAHLKCFTFKNSNSLKQSRKSWLKYKHTTNCLSGKENLNIYTRNFI